ncbi:hypothetical protein BDU57DRAFT_87195 [Ampelomyces quisqualis]|uniref:Uncharacterized protein n=1 Tax=Ampelomyces quisqualis TaxID=50730 RepID=A0A6A5Q8R1_AMPQU|nr:hypothetical protein BDU57DRAFT_87195 [Ampelomyces quisqualis]
MLPPCTKYASCRITIALVKSHCARSDNVNRPPIYPEFDKRFISTAASTSLGVLFRNDTPRLTIVAGLIGRHSALSFSKRCCLVFTARASQSWRTWHAASSLVYESYFSRAAKSRARMFFRTCAGLYQGLPNTAKRLWLKLSAGSTAVLLLVRPRTRLFLGLFSGPHLRPPIDVGDGPCEQCPSVLRAFGASFQSSHRQLSAKTAWVGILPPLHLSTRETCLRRDAGSPSCLSALG